MRFESKSSLRGSIIEFPPCVTRSYQEPIDDSANFTKEQLTESPFHKTTWRKKPRSLHVSPALSGASFLGFPTQPDQGFDRVLTRRKPDWFSESFSCRQTRNENKQNTDPTQFYTNTTTTTTFPSAKPNQTPFSSSSLSPSSSSPFSPIPPRLARFSKDSSKPHEIKAFGSLRTASNGRKNERNPDLKRKQIERFQIQIYLSNARERLDSAEKKLFVTQSVQKKMLKI